jgi:hypothetical protein
MIHQNDDLNYGFERENINHGRLEHFLGVKLKKLGKYDTMDWVEYQDDGDDSPPWYVEQKARKMPYIQLLENYKSPVLKYPSALIGQNKIEYMKAHGNGMVIFDFTDRLLYWQFDESEYKKMEIEQKFVRGARHGYVDKPNPVVHIPCELLKEVPRIQSATP